MSSMVLRHACVLRSDVACLEGLSCACRLRQQAKAHTASHMCRDSDAIKVAAGMHGLELTSDCKHLPALPPPHHNSLISNYQVVAAGLSRLATPWLLSCTNPTAGH
jgi:hypothetical protein